MRASADLGLHLIELVRSQLAAVVFIFLCRWDKRECQSLVSKSAADQSHASLKQGAATPACKTSAKPHLLPCSSSGAHPEHGCHQRLPFLQIGKRRRWAPCCCLAAPGSRRRRLLRFEPLLGCL